MLAQPNANSFTAPAAQQLAILDEKPVHIAGALFLVFAAIAFFILILSWLLACYSNLKSQSVAVGEARRPDYPNNQFNPWIFRIVALIVCVIVCVVIFIPLMTCSAGFCATFYHLSFEIDTSNFFVAGSFFAGFASFLCFCCCPSCCFTAFHHARSVREKQIEIFGRGVPAVLGAIQRYRTRRNVFYDKCVIAVFVSGIILMIIGIGVVIGIGLIGILPLTISGLLFLIFWYACVFCAIVRNCQPRAEEVPDELIQNAEMRFLQLQLGVVLPRGGPDGQVASIFIAVK